MSPEAKDARTFRRSAAEVPVRQLVHRKVQILTTPEDGVGDLSVALARFAPGIAQGHTHWPGGEAVYVVEGEGQLRMEGIPLLLKPGTGVFTPPCVEHHIENNLGTDMILVGAFCPSAIPGSYPDRPPRLQPSGRLSSVQGMYRHANPTAPVARGRPSIQSVVEDRSFSPHISLRLVRLAAEDSLFREPVPFTRAWLVLGGTGDLVSPKIAAGRIQQWDLVVVSPGTGLQGAARGRDLTMLELDAHLDPDQVRKEPCE